MQALNDFNRVYIYNKTLCLICSFLLIFIPAKKTFCISLFLLTCLPPQVHHALSKKIRSCLLWFVVKIFCNSHHWTYHGLYLVSSLLLSKSWRAVGTHCLHFLSFHSFLSILQFNFSSQQRRWSSSPKARWWPPFSKNFNIYNFWLFQHIKFCWKSLLLDIFYSLTLKIPMPL